MAEPVRRTAQPVPGPPGVDYHRLSPDEHEWTYLNLILPGLGEMVAQERPVVVYAMGAPGAGKTSATMMVRRALRQRRPVWITGELFKAAHPDYFRLLREHPRTASARIRADYKAWQARAEKLVRQRRADAVIEVAPGSAHAFLADAGAWRRAGYRVELLVLDVRAADSRQGTALRYAEVSRGGTRPGRFTTAAGHDRCRRENLCVVGPSGTGKSHFTEALGQAAVDAGMTVAWFTIEDLGALVRRHRVDDSVSKAIARITRTDLIIVELCRDRDYADLMPGGS